MSSLRRQPIISSRRPWSRWWWLAAIVAVLTMPSSFRGGADVPHPHAFFQFWGQAPAVAFAHHAAHHHEHVMDGLGTPNVHDTAPSSHLTRSARRDRPDSAGGTDHGDLVTLRGFASLAKPGATDPGIPISEDETAKPPRWTGASTPSPARRVSVRRFVWPSRYWHDQPRAGGGFDASLAVFGGYWAWRPFDAAGARHSLGP
ncbi:MAG: hypothetical protein KatS3mg059_0638 [Thermomicrobiales bacterium]|nr:MAG: hypothetical protein KatS3mg059_0638 [Thermomicrobiales bacterium]